MKVDNGTVQEVAQTYKKLFSSMSGQLQLFLEEIRNLIASLDNVKSDCDAKKRQLFCVLDSEKRKLNDLGNELETLRYEEASSGKNEGESSALEKRIDTINAFCKELERNLRSFEDVDSYVKSKTDRIQEIRIEVGKVCETLSGEFSKRVWALGQIEECLQEYGTAKRFEL